MPRLKPDTQLARRNNILDAAECCFVANGFHPTTMQDICKEAGVSPGAVYVYFDSKEALIAGLCERERTELSERLGMLRDAPNLIAAFEQLANHYVVEHPRTKNILMMQMGMEATRNPVIAEIHKAIDQFVIEEIASILQGAMDRGEISPINANAQSLAKTVCLVGDGMFWRRAVDKTFDAEELLPQMMALIIGLLRPVDAVSIEPKQSTNVASNDGRAVA